MTTTDPKTIPGHLDMAALAKLSGRPDTASRQRAAFDQQILDECTARINARYSELS